MPVVDQLDINLHSAVTIEVRRIPGGGLFISLGERDQETVRILADDEAADRLRAALQDALVTSTWFHEAEPHATTRDGAA